MACYGIFDVEVTDPVLYETYKAGTEASIKAAGGKYIVRGGETELLEGGPSPNRIIVLEFPTRAAFDAWYHGAEYAKSLPIRLKSARTRAFSVVGL
jgi:uncharacterized protein (DUF1330 family)